MRTGCIIVGAAFPGVNGKIAFSSQRDGNTDVYPVDPDGTGEVRLTTNAATDQRVAWSADGRRLVFVSERDGNQEIYRMNADANGSSPVPIFDPEHAVIDPDWSPDGLRISYTANGTTERAWVGGFEILPRPGGKLVVKFVAVGGGGIQKLGAAKGRSRRGRIVFKPIPGVSGVRQVGAEVIQDGLPRGTVTVARFKVP